MTIKDLLDEYAGAYMQVNGCSKDVPNCKMCVEDTKRMSEIIQEVEALVRKETIGDILFKIPARYSKYRGFALDEGELAHNGLVGRIEHIIKEYAQSKGITP